MSMVTVLAYAGAFNGPRLIVLLLVGVVVASIVHDCQRRADNKAWLAEREAAERRWQERHRY